MTIFRRDGHWRTSKYGVLHQVSSHSVHREHWERYTASAEETERYFDILRGWRALGPAVARFINPNSNCPVCGASVFYYQNSFGSKVFFDTPGPPWPKHPCTDNEESRKPSENQKSFPEIFPLARSVQEIKHIQTLIAETIYDPEWDHQLKYGQNPWAATKIIKRISGHAAQFFVLEILGAASPKKLLISTKARRLKEGAILFVRKGRLSYFDSASMTCKESVFSKYRSSAAFLDAVVAEKPVAA